MDHLNVDHVVTSGEEPDDGVVYLSPQCANQGSPTPQSTAVGFDDLVDRFVGARVALDQYVHAIGGLTLRIGVPAPEGRVELRAFEVRQFAHGWFWAAERKLRLDRGLNVFA
jgi:hypothetical protein